MCGIFGFCVHSSSSLPESTLRSVFRDLFLLSERRGKEASGFALRNSGSIRVYKSPMPASQTVKSEIFRKTRFCFDNNEEIITAIGHARLVTNGSEALNENNQPIVKNDIVCVHNGIIVNERDLWNQYRNEPRLSQVDSELIPTLLYLFIKEEKSMLQALRRLFKEIYGMTSTALLFNHFENLILATNNGSLYYAGNPDVKFFMFASEYPILESVIKSQGERLIIDRQGITHLAPNKCLCLTLKTVSMETHSLDGERAQDEFSYLVSREPGKIDNVSDPRSREMIHYNFATRQLCGQLPRELEAHAQRCKEKIDRLQRCAKCILPETFPFIEFNEYGVCNYCKNYVPLRPLGENQLKEIVAPFRMHDGRPNCIVGFSGGRDSCFSLHYVKHELKLTPLAFSYDWGMLTDLGRRNQSRLCGALGVEHVLCSADIRVKRNYIKKNVLAWLKNPNLGIIPLFMAGDKQYFYYAHQLMKQHGIKLMIFGENKLETTFFKHGFCAVPPDFDAKKSFTLRLSDKLKMAKYYLGEYLKNPAYLNISLLDTTGAFLSYYFIPHHYINLFNYVRWDEQVVVSTLLRQYDWELAADTASSWRIGDGTAAFYNYIYYTAAGFTENDTFRSNQIREGMLTREEGLRLATRDNQPRYESINWYCNIIGIDYEYAIRTINAMPKLYGKH